MAADNHKWYTLFSGCIGVGTIEVPVRASISNYSDEYNCNDVREDITNCASGNPYTFLTDAFISDAALLNAQRDSSIEFIAEMPVSFETPLADFLSPAEISNIFTKMESRRYTYPIIDSMSFRDLYRVLLQESIFRRMFGGGYFADWRGAGVPLAS